MADGPALAPTGHSIIGIARNVERNLDGDEPVADVAEVAATDAGEGDARGDSNALENREG